MKYFDRLFRGYGAEVVSWRQENFHRERTVFRGGLCGPLSAKWLKDRALGRDFFADTDSSAGRNEIMWQRLTIKPSDEENLQVGSFDNEPRGFVGIHWVHKYLAHFGLANNSYDAATWRSGDWAYPHSGKPWFSTRKSDNYSSAIRVFLDYFCAAPAYYYMELWRPSGGGHALSFDLHRPGFFDSNGGEANFNTAATLHQACTEYLRELPWLVLENDNPGWFNALLAIRFSMIPGSVPRAPYRADAGWGR